MRLVPLHELLPAGYGLHRPERDEEYRWSGEGMFSPCAFYRRWVCREAVPRAISVGMAEHLQYISIHPGMNDGSDIRCAVPRWRDFEAMALPVHRAMPQRWPGKSRKPI